MSESTTADDKRSSFSNDLLASVVVFLVALPLCMGISIASGAPPALGLVTGIVGGLVVGFLAGQPLQVSGPAAGLAVLCYELIQSFGLQALGAAVFIGGVFQLIAGIAGLGRWFRAVSPAVVQGMLTGIGVLILASQFHVMLDDKPRGGGLLNLVSIPDAIYSAMLPFEWSIHHQAAAVGVTTIASIVLWNKFKPKAVSMLPGALVGVIVATAFATLSGMDIARVAVPSDLMSTLNWLSVDQLPLLSKVDFWVAAVGLAIIASAETLLCATAVDRMHDGPRTLYSKELRGQGIGNMICGLVGALPMTGVIVRSSANVEAGGKTKWSAIIHGFWILLLVVIFPQVLAMIPTACLAGILVYTGWKLINIPALKRLASKGRIELAIAVITAIMIVSINLLAGVAIGFGLALIRLTHAFANLEVDFIDGEGKRVDIVLRGSATFMSLPKLAETLEKVPDDAEVHVHLELVNYIDHACMELMSDWDERHPGTVTIDNERLQMPSARPTMPQTKDLTAEIGKPAA